MGKNASLDFIYEEVKTQITRQFHSRNVLDTKAHITIGLAGIILGLALTKTPLLLKRWFCLITIAFLFLSFVLSLIGLWIRGWRADPSPSGMKSYLDKEESETKRKFLENLIESYNKNNSDMNKKANYTKFAMICLLIGLITAFIWIFMK